MSVPGFSGTWYYFTAIELTVINHIASQGKSPLHVGLISTKETSVANALSLAVRFASNKFRLMTRMSKPARTRIEPLHQGAGSEFQPMMITALLPRMQSLYTSKM